MIAYALLIGPALVLRLVVAAWPVVTVCAAIGATALCVVLRAYR